MKRRIVFAFTTILLLLVVFTLSACKQEDKTAPVFENAVNGEYPAMTVNLKDTKADFMDKVKATDETDGEVTPVLNKGTYSNTVVGTYVLTYTATDKAGNIATATRKVTVVDSTAPLFVMATSGYLPDISHQQYKEFDLLGGKDLEVRDNYDTNIVPTIKNKNGYDKDVAGVYELEYSAIDSNNNETTVKRKITVTPTIKYTVDVIVINGDEFAVSKNNETALTDNGSGLKLRSVEEIQYMTKAFYVEQVTKNASQFATNGGIPYLPWGVAVVLDKDYNPVLVRNAAYAIEAIKLEDGWHINKNGNIIKEDGTQVPIKTTFLDATGPAATGIGVLGGDFVSYIPDGGFVLLVGSPHGGAADKGKIFLVKHLLDSQFGGGSLAWEGVERDALNLVTNAKVSYLEQQTTIWDKPANMVAPELTMEKHVLSWAAVEGAKEYQVFINGEFKFATTATSVKMFDVENLPANAEGEKYVIKVKVISKDIRYYGDSEFSKELEYVKPDAKALTAPVVAIDKGVVTWAAVEGASGYTVYGKQVGAAIKLADLNAETLTFKANEDTKLANLIYNANIYVVAVGDGAAKLDSVASNVVTYMCSEEKVIVFNDDIRYAVIETTCADYFARRNDATAVGYAGKNEFFLITDPQNIVSDSAKNTEAFGYLVLFGSNGNVKSMVNIVTSTQQYINGAWVDATTAKYTANSKQLEPLFGNIVEGDKLLIGRNAGTVNFTVGETTKAIAVRDILANYYWAPITVANGAFANGWKAAATVTAYPKYTVKLASQKALPSPVLSVSGTVVSWAAVEGATSYDIYFGDDAEPKHSSSDITFDLMDYITTVGKTGGAGNNYSDVTIKVIAKGEGKDPSKAASKVYTVSSVLKTGEEELKVNYNVESSLWNGSSGANCRTNDLVNTLMTGASYKHAYTEYAPGQYYAPNAYCPWMTNGIIIRFDKDLKIIAIRFGYTTAMEINPDGTTKATADLTWNNEGQIKTAPVQNGNFKNLEKEVNDDDYVLIVANIPATKIQLTQAIKVFIDATKAADIVAKKVTPATMITLDTFKKPNTITTQLVFTAVEKAE